MITRLDSRYLRIHPKYDFRNFPENEHFDNGYFREKKIKKSHIKFVRIQEFTLVIISVIFPQNDNFEIFRHSA